MSKDDARRSPDWPTLCPDCKRGLELGDFLHTRHPHRNSNVDVFPNE